MNSKIFKQALADLQKNVADAIKEIVGNRSLELQRGIIIATYDDNNECITGIHEDLTVDTDFNGDIMERGSELEDHPIHIQIALLEMLEDGEFEVADEETV